MVVRLCEASEEVALEMRGGGAPPVATTVGYSVEFVWKSATFDRMQRALKAFAVDETCMSGYLYHRCARLALPNRSNITSLCADRLCLCLPLCVHEAVWGCSAFLTHAFIVALPNSQDCCVRGKGHACVS